VEGMFDARQALGEEDTKSSRLLLVSRGAPPKTTVTFTILSALCSKTYAYQQSYLQPLG
jgi:hypothetical protein